MKHENKCKRKGKKVLLALEEKNLAKFLEENDKNLIWTLDWSKREREELFEKVWKWLNTWKTKVLKKLSIRFLINRKLGLINRKSLSIDPTENETHRAKPKFQLQFQSVKKQVRSIEILKKTIFWKTKQVYAETP